MPTLLRQRVPHPHHGFYSLAQVQQLALNGLFFHAGCIVVGIAVVNLSSSLVIFFCWGILHPHHLGAYEAPLSRHHDNAQSYILLSSIAVLSAFTILTRSLQTTSLAAEVNSDLNWILPPVTQLTNWLWKLYSSMPVFIVTQIVFPTRYEPLSPFCCWSKSFHHYLGPYQVSLLLRDGDAPFHTLFSSIEVLTSFTVFAFNCHPNVPSAKSNSALQLFNVGLEREVFVKMRKAATISN